MGLGTSPPNPVHKCSVVAEGPKALLWISQLASFRAALAFDAGGHEL